MLNHNNIRIIKSKLYYTTDECKYKIEPDIYTRMISGQIKKNTVLRATIIYKNSLTTRFYSYSKRNIPKKHKEIIKNLFEYYENNILIQMALSGIKFHEYFNWLDDARYLYGH